MKITKYDQVWEIWNQSKDQLNSYVLSRFKNKELSEEVTQEVLLKIHKSCCSDREISNLNSWLYQIAHNVSLDIIKKEAKQKNVDPVVQSEADPSAWDDLTRFLEPLINLLPEKYAEPLKMSDLDKIPQKEIASQLGLGLSATKSRIQRARELLKQQIMSCYNLELDKNGKPINAELKPDCGPIKDLEENN